MSLSLHSRMLVAAERDPLPVMPLARELDACSERMIAIQMTAYPAHWTEEESREMAEQHLFGRAVA
ncbi:hypothetical protein JMG10_13280 [Nostoc ellipsosporum NOK]|nr:hypothetical protein [Nostoc ellipsosporum NOK]